MTIDLAALWVGRLVLGLGAALAVIVGVEWLLEQIIRRLGLVRTIFDALWRHAALKQAHERLKSELAELRRSAVKEPR